MVSINTRPRALAAGLFAVMGFGAAGCGDSGSDTSPPSSSTSVPTQAAQVPTVSVPTTAPTTAPTAAGKTPKKKGNGKKTGKGSQTAAPVTSPGPVSTRAAQTVVPAATTDPNAVHVKVTITSGAVTVDPSTLPSGKNVIFDIFGKGVGSKGTATVYSGGQVYGVARVVPREVHMPTPPLVKGKVKIVIAGSSAISVKGTSVPVT